MNYTNYLKLNKPQPMEQYNISHWNDNSDKIDTSIKNCDTKISENNSSIVSLQKKDEELNSKIDTKISELKTTIEGELLGETTSLSNKIDTSVSTLNTTISDNVSTLNTKIDTSVSTLNTKINSIDVGVKTVNGSKGEVSIDATNLSMDKSDKSSVSIATKMVNIENSISELSSSLSADISGVNENLTLHSGNTNNPHGVTKSQVGLGNVVNVGTDNSPTSGSSNNVTSGGVFTELSKKQNNLTFDSVPTKDSSNPVTSGGVFDALPKLPNEMTKEKICEITVPNTATTSNYGAQLELAFRIFDKGYSYIGICDEKYKSFSGVVPLTDCTFDSTDGSGKGSIYMFPIFGISLGTGSSGIFGQCTIIDQITQSKNFSTVYVDYLTGHRETSDHTFSLYGWK